MKKINHLISLNAIDPFPTKLGKKVETLKSDGVMYHHGHKLKPGFSIKDGKLTYSPEHHAPMKIRNSGISGAHMSEGPLIEPSKSLTHLTRLDQTKPRLPSDSSIKLYQEGLHGSISELSRDLMNDEIHPLLANFHLQVEDTMRHPQLRSEPTLEQQAFETRKPTQSNQEYDNPLNFGNMEWRPELVEVLPITVGQGEWIGEVKPMVTDDNAPKITWVMRDHSRVVQDERPEGAIGLLPNGAMVPKSLLGGVIASANAATPPTQSDFLQQLIGEVSEQVKRIVESWPFDIGRTIPMNAEDLQQFVDLRVKIEKHQHEGVAIVELDSLTPIADETASAFSVAQTTPPTMVLHRSKERPKTTFHESSHFFDPNFALGSTNAPEPSPKPTEAISPRLGFGEYLASRSIGESVYDFLLNGGAAHAGVRQKDFEADMDWLNEQLPELIARLKSSSLPSSINKSRTILNGKLMRIQGELNVKFGWAALHGDPRHHYGKAWLHLTAICRWIKT